MEPEPSVFKVKRLTEHAILPVRSSVKAAGYDLSSAYDYIVPKRGKILVKTDLAIALPEGYYGRVAPRSGLALKHFIDVGAGVIDSDYRGNLGVVLFNHEEEDFEIKKGDRIAQLILEKITLPEILEVDELDETERGSGGFSSTGGGFANVNETKRLKLSNDNNNMITSQKYEEDEEQANKNVKENNEKNNEEEQMKDNEDVPEYLTEQYVARNAYKIFVISQRVAEWTQSTDFDNKVYSLFESNTDPNNN